MKYKIKESNDTYRVLQKNRNGNIGIHILLYICGWIFYFFCAYWEYISKLNSYYNSYYYYYEAIDYGPSPLLILILILTIFGCLNIIYVIYSHQNAEEIKIQIKNNPSKKHENKVKTNLNSNLKLNFCPNCGVKIKETDKFCPNCGNTIPKNK